MKKALGHIGNWHHRHKDFFGKGLSIFFMCLFVGFFIVTIIYYASQASRRTNMIIAGHVKQLAEILHAIDKECTISSFTQEKSYLNFLNVKSFSGSQVGSLNLAYPEKWQGPYLADNLTIEGHYYYVLKSDFGYYILPDDGVKLSDGKIMGRDIVITSKTNIQKLLDNEKALSYNGQPLIIKLNLKKYMMPLSIAVKAGLTPEDDSSFY